MAGQVQQAQNNNQAVFTQSVFTVALSSLSGAYGAYLWNIITPGGGAIFGATYAITSLFIEYLLHKGNVFDNSPEGQILKSAGGYFAGVAVSVIVLSAVGFSVTFYTAVALSLASLVAAVLIGFFAQCCFGINIWGSGQPARQNVQQREVEQNRHVRNFFQGNFNIDDIEPGQEEGVPNRNAFRGQGHRLGAAV